MSEYSDRLACRLDNSHVQVSQRINCLDPVARKTELVQEYRARFANPYVAAGAGFIDNVVEPHETRPRLINALEMLRNKQSSLPPKKHGNIPL